MTSKFISSKRRVKTFAIRFLKYLLKAGPVRSQAVYEAGRQAGISGRTLRRAKREMGIVSKKDLGYGRGWSWVLPAGKDDQNIKAANEDGQVGKMANQGGHMREVGQLPLRDENEISAHISPEGGQDGQIPTEERLAILLRSPRKMP
jgi:hypothetical protein